MVKKYSYYGTSMRVNFPGSPHTVGFQNQNLGKDLLAKKAPIGRPKAMWLECISKNGVVKLILTYEKIIKKKTKRRTRHRQAWKTLLWGKSQLNDFATTTQVQVAINPFQCS